ncbi:hypothetical protein [Methyloglobulus sp.]|uniref:hypothetical protein n=1 Tax=Methyloglobulus sp. TaxID=2518622 RepID=UPI00398946FD
MLYIKSNKMTLPLCLCVILALLSPAPTQAETTYESGEISATRAADQRAALAKKAEERKKRATERQKAAEAQKAVEVQKDAEGQKENAPAK